jgi:hypothetical protein
MKTLNLSLKIISLTFIFTISNLQICCAGETQGPIPKEDMDRIKKIYGFDKWVGKVKDKNKTVEKLDIDPNYFDSISKGKKLIRVKSEEWTISIKDKKTDLDVEIDISVVKDEMAAHTNVINFLALCTAPPPVCKRIDPNDPNNPLNIGDACFTFAHKASQKNKKEILRILMFCRNNVNVMLRNLDDDTKTDYPDLGEIARFIDKKLIAISKTK